MPSLPQPQDDPELNAINKDAPSFLQAADEIARRHALGHLPCSRITAGSLPVFSLGEQAVLKFFPPYDQDAHGSERGALEFLQHRLPVPTPRLLGDEEIDGWQVVVMSKLPGRPWSEVADQISRPNQIALAESSGALIAAIHGLDAQNLTLPGLPWSAFVADQHCSAVARQTRRGVASSLTDGIDEWLASASLGESAPVFLHTEVMREHLLVVFNGEQFELSGLVDFEPSCVGAAEYELASAGLFVACGDRVLWQHLLQARGYAPADINQQLQRRLFAWTLLHRYSNFSWYLERMPVNSEAPRLNDLADRWFPLAAT